MTPPPHHLHEQEAFLLFVRYISSDTALKETSAMLSVTFGGRLVGIWAVILKHRNPIYHWAVSTRQITFHGRHVSHLGMLE